MSTVSALVPVRNGMPYLGDALVSLQRQTHAPDEIVVVDDGSDDGTPDFLRLASRADSRVRVLTGPAAGLVEALNLGLGETRSDWIVRLDADDVALPHRIETQLRFLGENPDCVLVGSAYGFIDTSGRPLGRSTHLEMTTPRRFDPLHDPNVPHPSVMFRRDAVLELGGYRQLVPAEDLDLWLRLADRHPLGYLDDVLVDVRVLGNSISTSQFRAQRLMWAYVRTCARNRVAGDPEPLFEEWVDVYRPGWKKRLRWKAELSMRLAASSWAQGHRGRAVLRAAEASLYHPPTLGKKARRLRRRP